MGIDENELRDAVSTTINDMKCCCHMICVQFEPMTRAYISYCTKCGKILDNLRLDETDMKQKDSNNRLSSAKITKLQKNKQQD